MAQKPAPPADLPGSIGQAVYDRLLAAGTDAKVIAVTLQAVDGAVRDHAANNTAPPAPAKSAPPQPDLPHSAAAPRTPPPGVDTPAGKTTTA